MITFEHGTISRYRRGCLCDMCKEAKRVANRNYRLRHKPPKPEVPALSKAEHQRIYRAMLRRGHWEQGVHRRRVTTLTKYSGDRDRICA